MKHYLEALKRRKEETGESGFSLIELIVVVVILGVLAAIAVPVFLGLQGNAEQSAQDSSAATAASDIAAQIAVADGSGTALTAATAVTTNFTADLPTGSTLTVTPATGDLSLTNYCVTISGGAATDSESGPGC